MARKLMHKTRTDHVYVRSTDRPYSHVVVVPVRQLDDSVVHEVASWHESAAAARRSRASHRPRAYVEPISADRA